MNITTIPYTNNGKVDVIIGNVTVKPGTTRQVDSRYAPSPPGVNAELVVWYYNFGDSKQYFGDVTVASDSYARLSANFFVDPNTPADKVQSGIFETLLNNSVNIISQIAENSDLTPDELLTLVEIEKASKSPRKTLISELQTMANADPDDSYVLELSQMSDSDLDLEKIKVTDDDEKLAAVNAELAKRKG